MSIFPKKLRSHYVGSDTKIIIYALKISWFNKFLKIYNENGEGVYGELKEMALRYNTLVKKYFGMPKNIPPFKCEKLKDLLHGSFSSIKCLP